jgi:hypothetical protein
MSVDELAAAAAASVERIASADHHAVIAAMLVQNLSRSAGRLEPRVLCS